MSKTEALKHASRPHLPIDRNRGSRVTLAKGRWVKTYNSSLGVCMRPIKPRYGRYVPGGCSMGVLEEVLQEATSKADLGQLLLLVAHGSRSLSRKVHCFEKKTREHLGMIGITESEVDMLKKYENLIKYELRFTEQYLSVKRMARDKENIATLFDRRSGGDRNEVNPLSPFHTRVCPKEFCSIGIQVQMSKPQIRALKYPKIPVRLRKIENIRRLQKLLAEENVAVKL